MKLTEDKKKKALNLSRSQQRRIKQLHKQLHILLTRLTLFLSSTEVLIENEQKFKSHVVSFEVTIMVIGVSISWALNSYNTLVFTDCCDSMFLKHICWIDIRWWFLSLNSQEINNVCVVPLHLNYKPCFTATYSQKPWAENTDMSNQHTNLNNGDNKIFR